MNKTELLAALTAKFHYINTPTVVGTFGPIQRYSVIALDLSGDVMRQVSVDFYVENEGLGNETAYYNVKAPVSEADSSFQRDCEAYIVAKISDNTIRAAFLIHIDPVREIAVGWAYIVQSTNLVEVKMMLRRQAGEIVHTVVNTVINTGN